VQRGGREILRSADSSQNDIASLHIDVAGNQRTNRC
jgi:hypothetical protein